MFATKKADILTVVFTHARWCAPCRRIKPDYDKLKQELKNINFIDRDVSSEPDGFRGTVPRWTVYKDEKVVRKFVGLGQYKEMTAFITKI